MQIAMEQEFNAYLQAIGFANQSQFSGRLARRRAAGRDHERDGMSHRWTQMNTDREHPGETIRRSLLDPAPARARRRIVLLPYLCSSVCICGYDSSGNRHCDGLQGCETNPTRSAERLGLEGLGANSRRKTNPNSGSLPAGRDSPGRTVRVRNAADLPRAPARVPGVRGSCRAVLYVASRVGWQPTAGGTIGFPGRSCGGDEGAA